MHRTQKYSFFVYFETVFVYFETPWAMNRHFMSKKKRAHSGEMSNKIGKKKIRRPRGLLT